MTKISSLLKKPRPRHFVREWRKHRGMTQEELAAAIDITHGAISQLETGKVAYTQQTIEALAIALSCEPRDLIGRPPGVEWGVDHIMARATADQKRQLHDIALTIVGPDRKAGA
jgi:transcriptional regulator with XRE-family HTH domain